MENTKGESREKGVEDGEVECDVQGDRGNDWLGGQHMKRPDQGEVEDELECRGA